MAFIFDKLELGARGRSGSVVSINSRITPQPRGQVTSALTQSQPPTFSTSPLAESPFPAEGESFAPEDVIELVCSMQTVDPKITLATLKHYYGSGGDMLLHYKLKDGVTIR
jgi:WD repeat-containing protein 48